jgi:hypothetical protein
VCGPEDEDGSSWVDFWWGGAATGEFSSFSNVETNWSISYIFTGAVSMFRRSSCSFFIVSAPTANAHPSCQWATME